MLRRVNKKLIFIILGVVVIGAIAWFMFLKPKPPGPDLTKVDGPTAGLGEAFIVNMKDDTYIKMGVAIKLSKDPNDVLAVLPDKNTKQPVLIGDVMPDARDAVIELLTDTTAAEIRSAEGREQFKKSLLKELKARFKKIDPPLHPRDVLITEFSLQ